MTTIARSSGSSPVQTPHQDWDETAHSWGQVVGFEKEQILGPALIAEINAISALGGFDKTFGALDYGCGFFTLGVAMLRAGIPTDGMDTSPEMVDASKATVENAEGHLTAVGDFKPSIQLHASNLPQKKYGLAVLSFVHQCSENVEQLEALFTQVGDLLVPGTSLIIIGAHPNKANLSEPHASCEYDWPKDRDLRDGDPYTGRIYNGEGHKVVDLVDERYWSLPKLHQVLGNVGFYVETTHDVPDKSSSRRPASKTAPFFMTTAIRLNKTDPNMIQRFKEEGRLRS